MRTQLISPSRQLPSFDRLDGLLRARRGYEDIGYLSLDEAEGVSSHTDQELTIVFLARDQAARTLEIIRRQKDSQNGHILVVGPANDPKLILRAMQAGGDLFIDQDEIETELDVALSRFNPHHARGEGTLIAVLSASGGCGGSTVAVNLASLLAKKHGRCNLIDLNTNKPDLAPFLDLKPQYTLSDLCRHEDRLDRTLYEKLLTVHANGVALLPGATRYADSRPLSPDSVQLALSLARESFASVVVDLENCSRDDQLVVLDQATRILVVSRLDFIAIRNTRRMIDHLADRGIPRDRIEVVVNNVGLPNQVPVADAETALGTRLPHLLPHDPETASWAANAGIPAFTKAPSSPLVQGIARLVGLDTPLLPAPDWLGRVAAFSRERAIPRLRSILRRIRRSAPQPPPLQVDVDTKVCNAPTTVIHARATERRPCAV
jgi:pilus assembly protein CpaE